MKLVQSTIVFAVIALGANASCQQSDIRQKVINLAAALDIPLLQEQLDVTLISNRGIAPQYSCTDGNNIFFFSEAGFLRGYTNGLREREIRRGVRRTGQRMLSAAAAVAKGKQFAQVVGYVALALHVARSEYQPDSGDVDPNLRSRATIYFEYRPGGYSSGGLGGVDITFDIQDGQLLSMRCSRGWRYGSPTADISESQAIAAATSVVSQASPSANVNVLGVDLHYAGSNGLFDSDLGQQYRQQKVLRLCYIIKFERYQVYIDAQTGTCLGGVRDH